MTMDAVRETAVIPPRTPADESVGPALLADELRLLTLLADGAGPTRAAAELHVSARTFRRRLRAICDHLDVTTPLEAAVWAARRGLI